MEVIDPFQSLGRALLVFGSVLAAAGGLILIVGKIPYVGRLPGDIFIQKKSFTFYFPLGTCLLLSVILSFVFALLRRR